MTVHRYDGSFAGLLCVLSRLFAVGEIPAEILSGDHREPTLFQDEIEIATEDDLARRFLAAVQQRTSPESARNLLYLHASEAPQSALCAYRYLALGRRLGPRLDAHLTHPDVLPVHRLVGRVRREVHRFKGLVRFRELADGLLYAPVEPEHAILPFLAPHFARRMPKEEWLIHDLRRGSGILGRGRSWCLGAVGTEEAPILSETEPLFQDLWKRFFAAVAIPERVNPKLQQQFMPRRYWAHLVEMEEGRPR